MSGYRYYEFCRINKPISSEAREEMASLSSRARITTHGASFVYNYGDFRGKPKQLLLKYFDVFFYVSNFGIIELIFKYKVQQLELAELKKYCIKHEGADGNSPRRAGDACRGLGRRGKGVVRPGVRLCAEEPGQNLQA